MQSFRQNVYFVLYINYLQFFQYISLQTFKHKYSLLCHTYLIGALPLQNGTKITPVSKKTIGYFKHEDNGQE